MKISLISIPYDLGRLNSGHGSGPASLLGSGLERLLEEGGCDVERRTITYDDGEALTGTQSAFRLNAMLSRVVALVVATGAFPIVLAGNCMTASGTLAGLRTTQPQEENGLGMLWMDAHADFNTPDTTVSGYLDGMALSVACGRSWKLLAARDPLYRPIREEAVVLVGTRDLDPEEEKLLTQSKVRIVRVEALRKGGGRLPADCRPHARDLYLHLDCDVLDDSVGRANRFSSSGGLKPQELSDLLTWAAGSYNVVAIAVTAYDSLQDEDGALGLAIRDVVVRTVGTVRRNHAVDG